MRHGVVASASPIASQIGVDVLRRGGNAVDAAVAVALAVAVTIPSAGNLGGGGFMLVRRADGRAEVIDYRERAPLAATRDMFLRADGTVDPAASDIGYRAVAVPGTVAGLALALERHGTEKWGTLVEPARRLAANGFVVNFHLARSLRGENYVRRLAASPDSRRIFLRDGRPWEEGEIVKQPELAATLDRLRRRGPREFYAGETAKRIVKDMEANGGLITARDLRDYLPTVRQPILGSYRGYGIMTVPPPSSGGALLIQMFNILERFDLQPLGFHSASHLHLLVETMRRAFADRATHMGDSDFVAVPVAGLTSKRYAAERAAGIDLSRATASASLGAGAPAAYESDSTTHFTVVDSFGNVVANTYTLNEWFGSGITAPGTGVLLNNEMDDFTTKPGAPNIWGVIQSEANAIEPRKRPLSAMTPVIVLRDGRVVFAGGSPGGPRIISSMLQIISNLVDFGMNAQQAVDAPRIHHQWMPDEIYWEPFGVNRDTWRLLEAMGHLFREKPDYFSDGEVVWIDEAGVLHGASDPRRGGAPAGY